MAKRDIKVNYDSLKVTAKQLKKHRKAIDDLRKAMKEANKTVSGENESKATKGLEKKYKKAKKRIDESYEEADALYRLVDDYIKSMTGIIEPCHGMTRVGRNDVYMNLQSINSGIIAIKETQGNHAVFPASGIGKTEDEKQAMERNYQKVQNEVWGSLFPSLRNSVEASWQKLKGYYDKQIVDYENMDDKFYKRSEKIRHQYSSPWELLRQNTIDKMTTYWKILKGAVMAVVDLIKGFYSIGNMIYYGISADVAAIVQLVSSDPPKWTEEVLNDSEEYFGNIAHAVSHPVETVESMAQSFNDTLETEGLEYMVSYAITDFALGKAMAGGGKADDVTDVAKVADDADEVADVAKTADKIEDASDAVNTLEKVEDAYDDLDDLYESIYESQYDEAFDPIKEGAILEPDEMADLADLAEDADKIATVKKAKNSKLTPRAKKISRIGKKKYIETIDDLVERMKKDGISKDVSYKELSAKYGHQYYKKELQAAYTKYTGKKNHISHIDYRKILEEVGRPVKPGEHAHHIVYKKGLPGKMREIVEKAQEILYKYDIDPVTDSHNLVSAPNKGHSIANIQEVYDGLAKAEKEALNYCKERGMPASATKKYVKDSLYKELEKLGKIAAQSRR
ncbi:MAG: hypothetical protein NC124_05085 [Clostridium sp.]|nr:hypothetical protein [Clostridium sp.]